MEPKTLMFSGDELLLVERAIKFDTTRATLAFPTSISDEELASFALKVGFALVNLRAGCDAELGLTERECWWLREVIDILARTSNSKIGEGYSIKRKVYTAILAFDLDGEQLKELETPLHEEVKYDARSTDPNTNQD